MTVPAMIESDRPLGAKRAILAGPKTDHDRDGRATRAQGRAALWGSSPHHAEALAACKPEGYCIHREVGWGAPEGSTSLY